jgi:aminoglycoside phosphotransferase (APT) family kinase protein
MVDDAAELIVRNRELIDSQTARLAHGDFSPSNILVADGRVTGIVDWEGVKGAPRANDLAWWSCIAPDPIARIDPILEGYGQDLGDPDALVPMFLLARIRILVSMLLFANQVANTEGYSRSRQHLEEALNQARLVF